MRVFNYESIDEDYTSILDVILNNGKEVNSDELKTLEIENAIVTITNPRKRVIGNKLINLNYGFMSAELLWILQGRNDLESMEHYYQDYADFSDDGATLNGAYGQRIFRWEGLYDVIDESYTDDDGNTHPSFSLEHIVLNQFENAFKLLTENKCTRQAVISLYNPVQDSRETKDKPCTNIIQFTIRENKLNMTVYMRSNNVWTRLPYDTFNLTVIQELMAGRLGIDVGSHTQIINSLYICKEHIESAKNVIKNKNKYTTIYNDCVIEDARISFKKLDKEMANVYNVEATTRKMSALVKLETVEKLLYSCNNFYWRSIAAVIAVYNFKKANRSDEEINILRNYIGNEFNGLI